MIRHWLRPLKEPYPLPSPPDLRYCTGDDECIQYLEAAIKSWQSWKDVPEDSLMYEYKRRALRILKNQIYFAGCDLLGDDKLTKR